MYSRFLVGLFEQELGVGHGAIEIARAHSRNGAVLAKRRRVFRCGIIAHVAVPSLHGIGPAFLSHRRFALADHAAVFPAIVHHHNQRDFDDDKNEDDQPPWHPIAMHFGRGKIPV